MQPFFLLKQSANLLIRETDISTVSSKIGMCSTSGEPGLPLNRTKHVALRLEDHTHAMMVKARFVDCSFEKSEGADAYFVHHGSSFTPELPKMLGSERLAWSFDEVYDPLVSVDCALSCLLVTHLASTVLTLTLVRLVTVSLAAQV